MPPRWNKNAIRTPRAPYLIRADSAAESGEQESEVDAGCRRHGDGGGEDAAAGNKSWRQFPKNVTRAERARKEGVSIG